MRINQWQWDKISESEKAAILSRSHEDIEAVRESVTKIISCVKAQGDKALYEFSKTLDNCDLGDLPLRVSQEEINQAGSLISDNLKKAIKFAITNIQKFHSRQKLEDLPLEEVAPGIYASEKATPIESVAIYVPNGRGSFPSMLYMAAIPAIIAKVKRIVVTSPPTSNKTIDPATLYCCSLLGIDEVYRIGGAQAIAAFAYGTESIKPCVKITGPGSKYVTAAKRILYGQVDVGIPAGPSESIVLADESADPYLVALDLLTEAEHGSDSAALLITPSSKLAQDVAKEIEAQLDGIGEPRKKFILDVLSGYGGIITTSSMEEAISLVNQIATEHLQLAVKDPAKIERHITNAGEIILGQTPFSAANYLLGPNAILPTSGNAKSFSPLSVRDFCKFSSIIKVSEEGLKSAKDHVIALSDYEGFQTHKNAVMLRK